MQAVDIRVEYKKNPIGLGVASPRITWSDVNGKKQEAFRLTYRLNGGKEKSIEVASSSMNYTFEESFHSRDRVTFTIAIREEGGEYGEESEENSFEIGLLRKEDFKASFLRGDYHPSKRKRYPVDLFRKQFEIGSVKKARLYATACGLYTAEINGKTVGDGVLTPGFTDFRKRAQVQAYDVTSLLKEGKNEIVLSLADGSYRGSAGAHGRTNTFGTITKVFAQLEITEESGKEVDILTDDSWSWSNDGPIRFADLRDGERVDMRKVPSFSGRAKKTTYKGELTFSDSVLTKEKEFFKPVEEIHTPDGHLVYKFPYNIAGYVSFKIQAKAGEKIRLRFGEMLDKDGNFTQANIQCQTKHGPTPLQEIDVILKDGLNEYKPQFYYGGFRYMEVESEANVKKEDFTAIAIYADLEETSSFQCSNELINTFYKNTLRSLKGNSVDIPTDCPTRERMGWTGDSQVFFNSASYLMNYAPFAEKHVQDIVDRQWKDGRYPQIAPKGHEDWYMITMNGSVGWADAGVYIPYRFYLRYGDKRILEKNYDSMRRYAKFMMRRCGKWGGIYEKPVFLSPRNRRYLVNCGQSYGEWAEPKDVKDFVWTDFCFPHPEESTAYTYYTLSIMIEIAKLLGKEKDIPRYEKYRKGTKRAYQALIKKKKFSLDTDRQAKLIRPLYMGLLPKEEEEKAKDRLIKALDHYGWRLGTGFLSTPFILDVLSSIDVEYTYKLLENEEMPGWLFMAKNDTTSIWEAWEGPFGSNQGIASLNHYSKGALVEWLMRGMAGINVDGENHFRIKPLIGGKETYCKASYKSIYGEVKTMWKREGDKIQIEVSLPSNTTAHIVLPDGKETDMGAGTKAFEIAF